jgi:hypothetical protein
MRRNVDLIHWLKKEKWPNDAIVSFIVFTNSIDHDTHKLIKWDFCYLTDRYRVFESIHDAALQLGYNCPEDLIYDKLIIGYPSGVIVAV